MLKSVIIVSLISYPEVLKVILILLVKKETKSKSRQYGKITHLGLITNKYGKEAIKISENNIIVTIQFNRINKVGSKVSNKVGNKLNSDLLNTSQVKVLAKIRNNPNITKSQLMIKCDLGKTSIDNIIKTLKKEIILKE